MNEIEELKKQISLLRTKIWIYGNCLPRCNHYANRKQPCNCGWQDFCKEDIGNTLKR